MTRKMRFDWAAPLFTLCLGLATVLGSLDYRLGSLSRMGPGYFPLILGSILLLLGLIMLATPTRREERPDPLRWRDYVRPWLSIILGVLAFIVLGQYGGFVPATFALILITALGDRENTLKGALALAALATVVVVGIFYYGIHMQFEPFIWG